MHAYACLLLLFGIKAVAKAFIILILLFIVSASSLCLAFVCFFMCVFLDLNFFFVFFVFFFTVSSYFLEFYLW